MIELDEIKYQQSKQKYVQDMKKDQILQQKQNVRQEWIAYKDCQNENPSIKFIPPLFYKLRWNIFRKFHQSIFGFAIGRIIMFSILVAVIIIAGYFTYKKKESSGDLAQALMCLTFVFIPKNSLVNFIIGLPFERAIQWHKALGVFSVIMGIYHATNIRKIKNEYRYITGVLLLILTGLMVILAFYKIRRAFYDIFYKIHMILVVIVLGLAIFHGAPAIFFGAILWGCDMIIRLNMKYKHRAANQMMQIEKVGVDILKLSFERNDFEYCGGQYVFIVVPDITTLESHPFSISSSPYQNIVTLHVKVLGDWTRRLEKLGEQNRRIEVWIHGPYGMAGLDLNDVEYTTFAFISGGIGITPMHSITNQLIHNHLAGRPLSKIFFLSSFRHPSHIQSILIDQKDNYINLDSWSYSDISLLDVRLHLTQNHNFNVDPNLKRPIIQNRPNLNKFFDEVVQYAKQLQNKKIRIAVLCSGPLQMMDEAKILSTKLQNDKIRFDYHQEIFHY